MHQKLDKVLEQQLGKHMLPIDPSLEGVVRRWHPSKHPAARQVSTNQNKPFWLRQVGLQAIPVRILSLLRLNSLYPTKKVTPPQGMIRQHEDLTCGDSCYTKDQTKRFDRSRVSNAIRTECWDKRSCVVPTSWEHFSIPWSAQRESQWQRADGWPHCT